MALLATLGVLACFVLAGCWARTGSDEAGTPSPGAYRIAGIRQSLAGEDPPGGKAWMVYEVVVPSRSTKTDLTEIAHEVVASAKGGTPFSILVVEFYDRAELVRLSGAPLGWARFGGPLDSSIAPGDYEEMSLGTHLSQKDWGERPSLQEAQIFASFIRAMRSYGNGQQSAEERSEALRQSAESAGVSTREAERAIDEVQRWVGVPIGNIM